ncbi:hypothetical protein NDU88_000962 [Pleurodeles waltl]|uniref:Uncharacterized protein n=1 Tax=Pleurodeles waltl TaxID=8319 RepID=A0AAV7LBR6_PLEWA|nr:hypothetical protein NDU88_000962 [Pleurodeles waltl]
MARLGSWSATLMLRCAKHCYRVLSDATKITEWITPQPRRKKKPGNAARLSREHAAVSQARALKEANLFSSNHYTPLREDTYTDSNSLQGRYSVSASPLAFGRVLTPRVADDL